MSSLLVFLATIFLVLSCSRGEPDEQAPPAAPRPSKDPEAAKRLIAEGATVIDVRSPGEYRDDHLPNAVNIPVDEIASRLADVQKLVSDPAKPIVLYCSKGGRSAKAKRVLDEAGYQRVVNGGGLDDLQSP